MDILAGMLAYVAGLGVLFAGLAVSFFVFFSTPNQPLPTQGQPQSASAMLARPSTPNKPAKVAGQAKQSTGQSEKHAAAGGSPGRAEATASRELRRKPSTEQARRLIQEERARRWAYQQNSSFADRFLGYAD